MHAEAPSGVALAAIGHDLRQPLHAINLYIGVLRGRAMDGAMRDLADGMAEAAGCMQRMLASLIDAARIDAGALRPCPRPVPLAPMLAMLAAEFAPAASAKGLALRILPTRHTVAADPALLETILRNLLANAVKFCDSGAAGIRVRRRGGAVELTVFDTGIGIAPADRRRVFEPFQRATAQGPPRDGLGLGLAIVHRMAALLGTRVTLRSRPGQGSRFTLALPPGELSSPGTTSMAATARA